MSDSFTAERGILGVGKNFNFRVNILDQDFVLWSILVCRHKFSEFSVSSRKAIKDKNEQGGDFGDSGAAAHGRVGATGG